MHDDNQKNQMAENWARIPLNHAVIASWIIIKHGVPAGADKRDLILDIAIAEKHGVSWIPKQITKIAPPNHYVIMPEDSSGAGLRVRFSRQLVSVIGSSFPAHLARLVETNMKNSMIPLNTALKVMLDSYEEMALKNPLLNRKAITQKIVLDGAVQIIKEALLATPSYAADKSAGLVEGAITRTYKHVPNGLDEVAVSTASGAQRWYKVSLDDMSANVMHGEMSGLVDDYPLTPTLDFPLQNVAYSAMFLHERQEVRLTVNWEDQPSTADAWSNKLLFR